MTNKKIYNMLVEIQGQLEDAYYSLPDYNANSDGKSSLDGARCDVSNLMDDVERTILNEDKVTMDEEYVLVLFPDVQDYMTEKWFRQDAYLCQPREHQEHIDSAYFIPKDRVILDKDKVTLDEVLNTPVVNPL